MKTRYLTLAAAIATILHPAAQAQAQEHDRLEEITVTSSRVAIPLRQIGTSVSVITAADIEAHGNLSLVDVLRQMPAIATTSAGGAGQTTSLRIRGEEGFRTMTIFDGIRLTDPSSTQMGPHIEHVLSSGVGRVEVLRGPQGLSYGADAGGIVNISSRRPGEGFSANFDAQAGDYGTRQYSGDLGGGTGRFDYFLSLADFETDGFNSRPSDTALADDDGYGNTTAHGRVGFHASDDLRFDFVHRRVEGDSDFDNCYAGADLIHECRSEHRLSASRLSMDYSSESFGHSLAYATTRTDRENFSRDASAYPAEGELTRVEYVGSATDLPGFDMVFGADWEEAESNGDGRHNRGVYLEYLSDFSDRIFLTAGARHDDNDDFGTNTSHRVSGAYLVDFADGSLLKFRASHGTGFRAPSPYEIQYNVGPSAFAPAAGVRLRQETSSGHEFGVEYTTEAGNRFEATYFDQEVEDAIIFDSATWSGYLQDVGTSTSKGVELFAAVGLGESLDLTANYTFNKTERPNGLQRIRRPEHLANLGLSWFGPGERLNLNAFYRISRDSIDDRSGEVVALDDFEVLDLSVNYSVTDSFQLYGRLENALDEDYQEVFDYNTAGRAFYLGFKLRFQGL